MGYYRFTPSEPVVSTRWKKFLVRHLKGLRMLSARWEFSQERILAAVIDYGLKHFLQLDALPAQYQPANWDHRELDEDDLHDLLHQAKEILKESES